MASLISLLNLGSKEMFIDKYVQLRWDEIVDEEYSIDELVDLAEGREIQLGSYLKEKPKG